MSHLTGSKREIHHRCETEPERRRWLRQFLEWVIGSELKGETLHQLHSEAGQVEADGQVDVWFNKQVNSRQTVALTQKQLIKTKNHDWFIFVNPSLSWTIKIKAPANFNNMPDIKDVVMCQSVARKHVVQSKNYLWSKQVSYCSITSCQKSHF